MPTPYLTTSHLCAVKQYSNGFAYWWWMLVVQWQKSFLLSCPDTMQLLICTKVLKMFTSTKKSSLLLSSVIKSIPSYRNSSRVFNVLDIFKGWYCQWHLTPPHQFPWLNRNLTPGLLSPSLPLYRLYYTGSGDDFFKFHEISWVLYLLILAFHLPQYNLKEILRMEILHWCYYRNLALF